MRTFLAALLALLILATGAWLTFVAPGESEPQRYLVGFAYDPTPAALLERVETTPVARGSYTPNDAEVPRVVGSEQARARSVAKRFGPAYFAYQNGEVTKRQWERLRALSTPEIYDDLRSLVPRQSGAPSGRRRLRYIQLDPTPGGQFKAVFIAYYGDTALPLAFLVGLTEGQWRVTNLTPRGD